MTVPHYRYPPPPPSLFNDAISMIDNLAFVKLTWNNEEVILKKCLNQLLCNENGLEVLLLVNWMFNYCLLV